MGIFAVLASLSTLNLSKAQHGSSLNSTVDILVSDLKRQQYKAMAGDTEGRGTPSAYGIYFDNNRYILFHDTYNPSDSANFEVKLDGTLSLTPNSEIVFAKGSGEISGPTSITIADTVTSSQKTLTINKYGVVTAVN
jgi:hypothetical protein